MAGNEIGLKAVLDDKDFQAGLSRYLGGVDKMVGATGSAAGAIANMASVAGGVVLGSALAEAAGAVENLVTKFTLLRPLSEIIDALAAPLSGLGDNAILTAARTETLGVVAEVVGRNAGYSASEVDKFIESVKGMGITTQAAEMTITKMAQAQLDLSEATKLARIAQDAAVIGNINSSEALERMIYGLQSGQTEILRTLGLNVNFQQSYEKMADSLGRSTDSLTEAEKAQARMNAVEEAGAGIMGAYEAAMDTAGKKLNSMPRYVEELLNAVGAPFQEAFSQAIDIVTNFLKAATEWATNVLPGLVDSVFFAIQTFRDQLMGLTAKDVFEETAGAIEARMDRMGKTLELETKRHEAILASLNADIEAANASMGREMEKIAEKYGEKIESIEERHAEARARIQEQLVEAAQSYQERLAEQQKSFQQKMADMDEAHAERRASIQEQIADQGQALEEKTAGIRENLAEKLAESDEKYQEERARLTGQLATAQVADEKEALKMQIAALDAAQAKERGKLEAEAQKSVGAETKKNDKAVAKLQERIAKEDAAYAKQKAKAEREAADAEAKLTAQYNRQVEKLNTRLAQEDASRDKQLAKINAERAKEEAAIITAHDSAVTALQARIAKEDAAYDKQRKEITTKAREDIKELEALRDKRVAALAAPEGLGQLGKTIHDALANLQVFITTKVMPALRELSAWFKTEGLPAIQKFSDWVNGTLLPTPKSIWDAFSQARQAAGPVSEAFGKISAAAQPVVEALMPKLVEVWGIVSDFARRTWPYIREIVVAAMVMIGAKVSEVLTALNDFWQRHGATIMQIVSFLWDFVFRVFATTLANILDGVTLILQILTGDWEGAGETIERITSRTWKAIGEIVGKLAALLVDLVGKALGKILSTLSSTWDLVVKETKKAMTSAYDWVVDTLGKLPREVMSLAYALYHAALSMMQGLVNGIKSYLSSVTSSLVNTVSSAVSALWTSVTSGSISAWLVSAGQWVVQKIIDGVASVTTLGSRLLSVVQAAATSLYNSIVTAGAALYNTLYWSGQWVVQKIADGIASITTLGSRLLSAVQVAATSLYNNIVTAGSALFNTLFWSGQWMIQKVIDGLTSFASILGTALIDILLDAINGAFEALGLKSPSTLFYGAGVDMMRGLQMGIASQLPAISAQFQATLAAPAAAPIAAYAPAAPTRNTYQFNLGGNTIATAVNEAEFTARVVRAIRSQLR